MSFTGRPIKPPLALMSPSQIFIATSDILPLAASGPLSAMPKPILIGSAARPGDREYTMAAKAMTANNSQRTPARDSCVTCTIFLLRRSLAPRKRDGSRARQSRQIGNPETREHPGDLLVLAGIAG